MIRQLLRNRLLVLLAVIFLVSWALAFATGFWLLFRLAYVLVIAVPISYVWSRFNVNGLEVSVQRLVDRAQVGQKAEERITVRNPSWFPRIWLEVDDPSELPGATPEQRKWLHRVEKEYYHKWLQIRRQETAARLAPEAEDVLPIFPARFVNEAGVYEPGKLAAAGKAKLPPDAIAIVQQMLLWSPDDTRMLWLLGELYAVKGEVLPADDVFDQCTWGRGFTNRKKLMDHRHVVRVAADKARKEMPADVPLLADAPSDQPQPDGDRFLPSRDKVIAVIGGYRYGESIDSYVVAMANTRSVFVANGEDALERNIRMLLAGRVDLVLEVPYVFNAKAKQMGVLQEVREMARLKESYDLYIACSPIRVTSDEYLRLLDAGIRELRRTGELRKILDKYGVEDWKKP